MVNPGSVIVVVVDSDFGGNIRVQGGSHATVGVGELQTVGSMYTVAVPSLLSSPRQRSPPVSESSVHTLISVVKPLDVD